MDPDENTTSLPSLMLGGSLWAMRADALPRMLDLARAHLRGERAPKAASPTTVTTSPEPVAAGVAVIPLTGVLTPHGSWLDLLFGGTGAGVQGFRDQLARAVADPQIASIVIDVDSPGGSVGLVPEAAAEVRAARDIKPVVAVANTQAASGAYYIASQASELYVTPSGMVGSVGVYYVHEDWSGFNEKQGIDVTYIYAGRYKVEGNPDEPLSDDARAAWQADADALYEMFVNDVALGRGTTADLVRSDYGEGRCLLAQDALAAGMVDGVETLQTIVDSALADALESTGASARRFGRGPSVMTIAQAREVLGLPRLEADAPDGELEESPAPPAPEHAPADAPTPDESSDGPEPEAEADAPDGELEESPAEVSAEDRAAVAALLI